MVGKKIHLEKTEARLATESSYRSKRLKPAVGTFNLDARTFNQKPGTVLAEMRAAKPNASGRRLRSDDAYSAGICSGLHDMAASTPRIVARVMADAGVSEGLITTIDAALRAALLHRMETLMNLWGISPAVTADDGEIDLIEARDTWVGRSWDADTLDDAHLEAEIAAEASP